MPAERIDQLLGGLSVRVAPQEFGQIGGDAFAQATNAIYVSADELEHRSFLVRQLTFAVGLESLPDSPTIMGARPTPVEGVKLGRYPGFSFCVQAIGIDPGLEAVAKAKIESALLQVMQHQDWKLLRRDSVPPIVDIGCPSEPLVARPEVKWNGAQYRAQGDVDRYKVEAPSFYHT